MPTPLPNIISCHPSQQRRPAIMYRFCSNFTASCWDHKQCFQHLKSLLLHSNSWSRICHICLCNSLGHQCKVQDISPFWLFPFRDYTAYSQKGKKCSHFCKCQYNSSKSSNFAFLTRSWMQTLQAPVSGKDTSHPTSTTHHSTAIWIRTWGQPRAATATAVFPTVYTSRLAAGALLGPHADRQTGEPDGSAVLEEERARAPCDYSQSSSTRSWCLKAG